MFTFVRHSLSSGICFSLSENQFLIGYFSRGLHAVFRYIPFKFPRHITAANVSVFQRNYIRFLEIRGAANRVWG